MVVVCPQRFQNICLKKKKSGELAAWLWKLIRVHLFSNCLLPDPLTKKSASCSRVSSPLSFFFSPLTSCSLFFQPAGRCRSCHAKEAAAAEWGDTRGVPGARRPEAQQHVLLLLVLLLQLLLVRPLVRLTPRLSCVWTRVSALGATDTPLSFHSFHKQRLWEMSVGWVRASP